MTNRLPLPTATVKEIKNLIDENSNNLWVRNPLVNALRDVCNYDYADAIKVLSYLQKDYPELMNYGKHINAIAKAEKRYTAI